MQFILSVRLKHFNFGLIPTVLTGLIIKSVLIELQIQLIYIYKKNRIRAQGWIYCRFIHTDSNIFQFGKM